MWKNLARTLRLAGLRREAAYMIRAPARNLPLPGSHTGYRRFVIVAPGRSGSNMLVERCASHPEVECFGELMHPDAIYWLERLDERSRRLRRRRDARPVTFLRRHVWHRYPLGVRAVGFKLIYGQLLSAPAAFQQHLMELSDLHVLHLGRRDVLAGYVSFATAMQTRVWRITSDRGEGEDPRLVIDPEECRDYLEKHVAAERGARARLFGHPVLDLDYEDLIEHPERENRRICKFLGVADRPLRHRSTKISRSSALSRIANLDELRGHFAGSKWAGLFEEQR